MKGQTHVMIAVSGAAAYATWINDIPFKDIPWVVIFIASLLPDIDEPNSMMSNPSKILGKFLPKMIGVFLDLIVKILVLPFRMLSKHRGLTHAPIVLLATAAGIAWYDTYWAIWFLWGYGSHLFADFLTPHGIPLAWPTTVKNYSASLIKTGSVREIFVFTISCLVLIFCCSVKLIAPVG